MNSANVEPVEEGDPSAGDRQTAVTVEGQKQIFVSASRIEHFPRERRTCTVECASGVRTTDEWTGVPIDALATIADFPGETTHLRVAADDFVAEIPIRAAVGGILAFDRCAGRDDEAEGLPRLIADDVPGERLVKRVSRISAVVLDAGEDPVVG